VSVCVCVNVTETNFTSDQMQNKTQWEFVMVRCGFEKNKTCEKNYYRLRKRGRTMNVQQMTDTQRDTNNIILFA
jgi:hypothetical protein